MALARLRRKLGVSRVARVTGLDRTGVEVACAVRPGGHVLQVTNGKGLTFPAAEAGAVLEAAELAGAERVCAADLRWATPGELRQRGMDFIPPAALGGGPSVAGAPLAWRTARDLFSDATLLVPAAAVHVPPEGGPLLGVTALRWTSNGMGAHPSSDAAVLHAMLEAVERDAVARSLPDGWTGREIQARRIPPAVLRRHAPAAAALASRLGRARLDVHVFDLSSPEAVALPVAGALLVDRRGGAVPLTAGYACRLDGASAVVAAMLEAAQSRLTDIHGAREDVADAGGGPPAGLADAERVAQACAAAAAPALSRWRWARQPRRPAATPRDGVRHVLARLRGAGHSRCAVVDLGWDDLGVSVVKVLVPGLLLSHLL